jgi:hypothetical protein
METTLVKLAYKQVIDASADTSFERSIFHASYDEFLLKSQTYNMQQKYKTFSELKANDGRANSLHYECSFAIIGFVAQLKKQIPNLKDNLGNSIAFDIPQFELIESDINDRMAHKVAINYITDTLTLCGTMGEYLLLAKGHVHANEPFETFMVKMQPNLAIVSYQLYRSSIDNMSLSILN